MYSHRCRSGHSNATIAVTQAASRSSGGSSGPASPLRSSRKGKVKLRRATKSMLAMEEIESDELQPISDLEACQGSSLGPLNFGGGPFHGQTP